MASTDNQPTLRDFDDAAFVACWLGERPEDLVEPDPEIDGVAALNAIESELSSWFELPIDPVVED